MKHIHEIDPADPLSIEMEIEVSSELSRELETSSGPILS
jgi:hypothetical protein